MQHVAPGMTGSLSIASAWPKAQSGVIASAWSEEQSGVSDKYLEMVGFDGRVAGSIAVIDPGHGVRPPPARNADEMPLLTISHVKPPRATLVQARVETVGVRESRPRSRAGVLFDLFSFIGQGIPRTTETCGDVEITSP